MTLFIQVFIYTLKISGKCAFILPNRKDFFQKENHSLRLGNIF